VHRSGIAYRAIQGARETGRSLEAVGNVAEPGRLGAVLALIAGGLARTWARNGAAPHPTNEEQQMETVELSQQKSARTAELPEDYRVVGVELRTPLVRKPTGQIIRIQQNGRVTAARHRLVAVAHQRLTNQLGDAPWHESS
jgi:hypothetical protein